MITASIPSFTEDDLKSAKERKAILDALYELTEQIRRTTSNIDESSFSPAYLAKIQAVQTAALAASESAGALREQTMTVRKALLQEIKDKANEIEIDYSKAIEESETAASSLYVKETNYLTDIGTLTEELKSLVEQTANQLTINFTNSIASSIAQFDDLLTRFTFSEDGFTINQSTSLAYMLLDADSITFQRDVTGGVEPLAELSTDGLITKSVNATDVHADGRVSAGQSVSAGRFKWVDEGSLGFSLVLKEG